METKKRLNSVLTHQVEGQVITFKVKDAGELMLDVSRLSSAVQSRAMLHGLVQRISDRAAIPRDTTTGLAVSPQEKFENMKVLVDWYETGTEEWSLPKRAGAVGPSMETQFLISALCEVYSTKSREELTAWVGKRSKEDRLALSQSEKLKVIIERLRGEMVGEVDAEGLLSELDV